MGLGATHHTEDGTKPASRMKIIRKFLFQLFVGGNESQLTAGRVLRLINNDRNVNVRLCSFYNIAYLLPKMYLDDYNKV